MKRIGYGLIALGFLVGALSAVVQEEGVTWGYYVAALVVGVVGVGVVRVGERRLVQAKGALGRGMRDLEASLDRLVAHVRELNALKATLDPYAVHTHIDEHFREDLATFAEARESLAHVHGLRAYADVMSHFAAGERYLNRIWSASADGYVDEVHAFLGEAEAQFVQAKAKFDGLAGSSRESTGEEQP